MTIAPGQVIEAAEILAALPAAAVKAASETVTSSTALQDDNHLFVSVTPGIYLLELKGIQQAVLAAGLKVQFSGPTATTGTLSGMDGTTPFTGVSLASPLVFGGTAANKDFAVWGRVVVTTAGTFRLRWAQNVSNATGSILRAETYLRLTGVA